VRAVIGVANVYMCVCVHGVCTQSDHRISVKDCTVKPGLRVIIKDHDTS